MAPRRRSAAGLALVAAVAAFAACSGSGLEGGPISLEFTSDRTSAAVGELVRFTTDAKGSNIQATLLRYGDGASDTVPAFNALTQRVNFSHAYDQPGSYVAEATVQDFFQGSVSRTIQIEITGAAQPAGER
jgi:PKD repeat protein